jgi:hypothetical protein
MATIALDKIDTVSAAIGKTASASSATPKTGFWRTVWNTIVDAQELRANTYVNGYLAHLTDGELGKLGMTRDQMIRRTRSMMTSL